MTQILIAIGTTARSYILVGLAGLVGAVFALRAWSRGDAAQIKLDRVKMATPVLGTFG